MNNPSLTMYHANAKGTGCAARWTLRPATNDKDGHIELTLAPQMTVGDRLATPPVFPRFDWENAIMARLDFNDLCLMLQVFRGETESVNDGKGLYFRRLDGGTLILRLRHMIDPVSGYSLEAFFTPSKGEERRAHVFLASAEALGLCESIAGAMYLVSFGVPVLIPHE